jgi:membrane protease YdiL (CAAX protease family)
MLEQIISYNLRILPGLILAVVFLILIPRNMRGVRIFAYIMIFILIRDAMTPLGFWSFGTGGFFWIRFAPDPLLLLILGLSSLGLAAAMYLLEPGLKDLVCWITGRPVTGFMVGVLAVIAITAPLSVIYRFVPLVDRGGSVAIYMLAPLLVVTLLGNLYEEFLFRGYFQGYLLARGINGLRAAIASGTVFAFGHVFLASTVTSVGAPLLVFVWYEGIIVSLVRMRYGMLPAALAHGGAIWVLAAGLV